MSRWDRLLVFGAFNIAALACFVICFALFPVLSLKPRKFAILYVYPDPPSRLFGFDAPKYWRLARATFSLVSLCPPPHLFFVSAIMRLGPVGSPQQSVAACLDCLHGFPHHAVLDASNGLGLPWTGCLRSRLLPRRGSRLSMDVLSQAIDRTFVVSQIEHSNVVITHLPASLISCLCLRNRWSMGSVLFLASWAVLMGPLTYAKHLLSTPRLPFTAAYFGSIALTLYFAVGVSRRLLFPCYYKH